MTTPASAQQQNRPIAERPLVAAAPSNPVTETADWGLIEGHTSPDAIKRPRTSDTPKPPQQAKAQAKTPGRPKSATILGIRGRVVLGKGDNGHCVTYVTGITDIKIKPGLARRFLKVAAAEGYKTSTDTPYIGGAVQLNEGKLGHVAIVTDVIDDRIIIRERNYIATRYGRIGSYIVNDRSIDMRDPKIVGYIAPEKV